MLAYEEYLPVLTPSEAEGLAGVRGVQRDKAHAVQHAVLYAHRDLVQHLVVRHVAPPDQHVGVVQHFLCKAVFGLIQRGGAHLYVLLGAQKIGDCAVYALGIDLGYALLVALVLIFVPYGYANHIHPPDKSICYFARGLAAFMFSPDSQVL